MKTTNHWIVWFCISIVVALYIFSFIEYANNIPYYDDHALKKFLIDFRQNSFIQNITLFFSQHNEHRIAYTRLVACLDYKIFGVLNYIHLMYVGNMAWLALFFLFYQKTANNYLIIIGCCLFFNALHWENTYWGMASIQNFTVVYWACLAFYGYSKNRLWLVYAAGVLAVFTSGNGILVLPIVAVLMALGNEWKRLTSFGVFSGILLCAYFYGYERPAGNPAEVALTQPLLLAKGFFAFLGAIADFSPESSNNFRINSCVAVGVVFFLLPLLKFRHYKKITDVRQDTFLWACLAFVAITALLVAKNRIGFEFITLLTSRYKVYSAVWVACIVLLFAQHTMFQKRAIKFILILFSLLFNWVCWVNYLPEIVFHNNVLAASQYNFSEKTSFKVPYIAPKMFFDEASQASNSIYRIDTLFKSKKNWVLIHHENQATIAPLPSFIYLVSAKATYLVPTRNTSYRSKIRYLLPHKQFDGGWVANIAATDTGKFAVWIWQGNKRWNTHRSIFFEEKPLEMKKNW